MNANNKQRPFASAAKNAALNNKADLTCGAFMNSVIVVSAVNGFSGSAANNT